MWHSTKRSSIFDLGSLTPKIWHKIAYKSACMTDTPEMFGPASAILGMADSVEVGTMPSVRPTLVAMTTKFGHFFSQNRV